VHAVQTHLEPISEPAAAEAVEIDTAAIEAAVREETGADARELRIVRTDDGNVVFLTLGLDGAGSLADAHGRASAIEERVRREVPAVADVVVHTEP
jgi:divalent metal cation (Fe/Co/Zn/Cd) transporter